MPNKPRSQPAPGTAVLIRALRVLDAIMEQDTRGGVTLQQVADHVGQHKSTVYRWLQALREYGLVEQNPATQTYRLGLKVLQLYGKLLSVIDLRAEAAPILADLTAETGETVHLGVYDRGEVVYLEKLDGPGSFLMRSRVGGRMPAYCTGLGKAMLAFLPAAEVEQALNGQLEPRTPNTITDPADFLRQLEQVRLLGYAVDNQENEQDVFCVAAPVFNHSGQLAAAISVSTLASRMTPERVPRLAITVRRAAERLSVRLGHQVASRSLIE